MTSKLFLQENSFDTYEGATNLFVSFFFDFCILYFI